MRKPQRRDTFSNAAAACAILAIMPVWIGLPAASVEAAPTEPSTTEAIQTSHPVGWQLPSGGTELTGLAPSMSIAVDIPAGWSPSDEGTLHVEYSLAENASGSLSIFVNGDYVSDIAIEHAGAPADLNIDSALFEVGANRIDLVSSIALGSDGSCPSPRHPARRVTIAEASGFEMSLTTTDIAWADLSGAMQSIGNTDAMLDLHMVGPVDSMSLTGAAGVLAAINNDAQGSVDMTLTRHDRAEFSLDTFDPAVPSIVIGDRSDLGLEPGPAGSGDLSVARSTSGQPVLVLTGSDSEAIATAAAAAVDPAQLAEFDAAASATVDAFAASEPLSLTPTAAGVTLTLADLDYPSRTLDGPGRDSTTYGFDLDINRIPDFASIRVDARRSGSSTLNGVGVIVNGERIGVAAFDVDGTTTDTPLAIPGAALRPGRNLVRLEADFNEPVDSCAGLAPRESIDISNASTIELGQPSHGLTLDLDDLPYTFRSPTDTAGLVVLLPSDPSDAELASALTIAHTLATSGSAARLTLIDDFDPTAGDHVVAIGDHDEAFISGLADVEPSPAAESGTEDAAPRSHVVLAQRSDTPDRLILILTGDDDDSALLAFEAITEVGLRSDLSGARATLQRSADDVEITTGTNASIRFPTTPDPVSEPDTVDESDLGAEPSGVSLDQASATNESVTAEGSDNSTAILAVTLAAVVALLAAAFIVLRTRRSTVSG